MPVRKCSNGNYRIGSGDCMYDSRQKAERAYAGYKASKRSGSGSKRKSKRAHQG